MSSFKEKLEKFKNKKIIIEDINGKDIRGELKESGEDYLIVLKEGKTEIMCNLRNIVSIEEYNEEFREKHIGPGA